MVDVYAKEFWSVSKEKKKEISPEDIDVEHL